MLKFERYEHLTLLPHFSIQQSLHFQQQNPFGNHIQYKFLYSEQESVFVFRKRGRHCLIHMQDILRKQIQVTQDLVTYEFQYNTQLSLR